MNNRSKLIGVIIPFRLFKGKPQFFLQQRDEKPKRFPNYVSFFGGRAEGKESAEQAMLREAFEELSILPRDYFLVTQEVFDNGLATIYAMPVQDDFESKVEVREGRSGSFYSLDEYRKLPLTIPVDLRILKKLCQMI